MIDSQKARVISDKLSEPKIAKAKKIRFARIKHFLNEISYKIKQHRLYKNDMKRVEIAICCQISKGNGIGYARVILDNKERTIPKLKEAGYDITEMENYQGRPMIDIRW